MDKNNKGFRNLKAWAHGNTLAHAIYDITESFPKSEIFGLISQMRRAALSVPANIAEGYTRKSKLDKKHFFNIALGSLTEIEYFIDFAFERKYYDHTAHAKLAALQTETAKTLTGLIKSIT